MFGDLVCVGLLDVLCCLRLEPRSGFEFGLIRLECVP